MSAKEITQRIYEDLQDALSAIAENIENPSAAIESVHVRVGERSSLIQSEDDLDPDPFSSKNGWVIDMAFSPFHLKKKGTYTFKTQSAFPLFTRLPLSSIKGIGTVWAKRFEAVSIRTIGALRNADDPVMKTLCRDHNSIQPLAYRHKAVQLDRAIPLELVYDVGHLNLHDLIKQNLVMIGERYPDPVMRRIISDFFDSCANSIDARILEKIRIGSLVFDDK